MDWGMKNRISRIIKPSTGRTVMLAIDHGYFLGPTSGLEDIPKNISPLIPHCDALMLTRGILRTSIDAQIDAPVVLRVSGGTSILGDLSNEVITTPVDEAVRLNCAAVAVSIFVGSQHEKETLGSLSNLVSEGVEKGMPVLAVTAVGKDMARDARYLGLCCRIAAELGAHIVKTYFCEDFKKVVDSCPVPVVVAGGKKISERAALELAHNAVSAGAVGVDMGRNIFQSDSPIGMIKAVRAVIHDGCSVDKAYDLYEDIKNS